MNELIQNYLSPLMAVFTNLVTIIVYGASMVLFVDPLIAVVIISVSVLMTFVPELTSRKLSVLYNDYLARLGKYTNLVNSYYLSKVFLDKKEVRAISNEHNQQVQKTLDSNMKYRKNNSLSMVLNGGSVEAISCIAFALTAIQLFQGKITVGMASAAFLYATKFMDPLYEFNVNIGRIKSTRDIQKKFLDILNIETDSTASSDTIDSLAMQDITKQFDNKTICSAAIKSTW